MLLELQSLGFKLYWISSTQPSKYHVLKALLYEVFLLFTIRLRYLFLTTDPMFTKLNSCPAIFYSSIDLFSKLNIPQRQINSLKNGDKWAPKRVIVLLEASFFFKQKHHIRAEDPSSAESLKPIFSFFKSENWCCYFHTIYFCWKENFDVDTSILDIEWALARFDGRNKSL